MANNKIVLGNGEVLMDLSADTVRADTLLKGYTAHGADGELVTGSCEFDANTQDATATDAEILKDKTAYNKGNKLVGTMPNNGAVSGIISTKDGSYIVPHGYHDGSGTVVIDADEKAKLIPGNIKQGVTILGVEGSHAGGSQVTAQIKEASASFVDQTILPDDGYDYLSQVKVKAISVVYADNSAGGKTVTIG